MNNKEREAKFAEQAWLNYFNRRLYEQGVITEKEYKKMVEKIAARKSKLPREKSAI